MRCRYTCGICAWRSNSKHSTSDAVYARERGGVPENLRRFASSFEFALAHRSSIYFAFRRKS